MDISEILAEIKQIESVDETDLIFHAIVARQQELATMDELLEIGLNRIDNQEEWDALHEKHGIPLTP